MIGQMDRKATLANPQVSKSASAGTTNVWVAWDTVWCRLEKGSGGLNENGNQRNLVKDNTITIRYSQQADTYLSKDTRLTIGGVHYRVTDYTADSRDLFIEIKATTLLPGTAVTVMPAPDAPVIVTTAVKSLMHAITTVQAGGFTFSLADLIGKNVINVQTGRAIPMEVITTGTPDGMQILYTTSTGTFTVSSDAPLMEDEKFLILYK